MRGGTWAEMDRNECTRHKQEDKQMDMGVQRERETSYYPIRLLKAIQARKQRRREKSKKKERGQSQSQQQISGREKHQSTAGEREEFRVTESSTVQRDINFQDTVDI